jgi:nucleotide-binding universal stress UspA family protein
MKTILHRTHRQRPAIVPLPALAARNGHARRIAKIVVPIDFSDESKEAIQYAVPFAREVGATVTLFHVTQPITFPADYGYGPVVRRVPDDAGMKRARTRLKGLGQKMIGPGILGETIVLSGDPGFEITEAARAIEADLIIIASHGRDQAAQEVGSTAEKVVRHASCPVFVLRKKERGLPGPKHKESYAQKTN